jgi:hypothetical protein
LLFYIDRDKCILLYVLQKEKPLLFCKTYFSVKNHFLFFFAGGTLAGDSLVGLLTAYVLGEATGIDSVPDAGCSTGGRGGGVAEVTVCNLVIAHLVLLLFLSQEE